jgi:hypothetical protein
MAWALILLISIMIPAPIFVVDMLPEDNHRQKMLKGADEYNTYQLMVDSGYHHQYMRNTLQLNQGIDPRASVFSEIGQLDRHF